MLTTTATTRDLQRRCQTENLPPSFPKNHCFNLFFLCSSRSVRVVCNYWSFAHFLLACDTLSFNVRSGSRSVDNQKSPEHGFTSFFKSDKHHMQNSICFHCIGDAGEDSAANVKMKVSAYLLIWCVWLNTLWGGLILYSCRALSSVCSSFSGAKFGSLWWPKSI